MGFPSIPSLKLRYARRRTGPSKWICSQDFDADSDWLKYLQHNFILLSVNIVLTATIFKDILIWKNYAKFMLSIPKLCDFLSTVIFQTCCLNHTDFFLLIIFDARKKKLCIVSRLGFTIIQKIKETRRSKGMVFIFKTWCVLDLRWYWR